MLKAFSLFFTAALLSGSLAWAGDSLSVDQIPDGYNHGRVDAVYGTYTSKFQDETRGYQERLNYLDRKAFGLASQSFDNVTQAKLEYVMEAETLRLFMDVINDQKLPEFEKQSLSLASIRLYETVRREGERLFEDMVRWIDIQKPGPNGLQIRFTDSMGQSLYYPNYRVDNILSAEEQKKAYQDKMMEFISSGGQLSEMSELNAQVVKDLPSLARLEYVIREDGQIWVTSGKAGHLLLAEGKSVRTAGQIVIVKNNQGQVQLSVVSNASGTYKPDLSSLFDQVVFRKLLRTLRVPRGQLIETRGEPLSTQALKIYLKGLNVDKLLISQQEKELLAEGSKILSRQSSLMCRTVYLF